FKMKASAGSELTLGAPVAALPRMRASVAGESALAAGASCLCGEEGRWSTVRSFPQLRGQLARAGRRPWVWISLRGPVGSPTQGGLIRRVRPSQRLPVFHLLQDETLEFLLGRRRLGDLVRQVGRDADHALLVADHDVAGVDGDLG